MEVKIPKEVRQHKESVFFGLSARQFFCSALAVILAVVVYLTCHKTIGKETASWLCILIAVPVAVAGFFTIKNACFNKLWIDKRLFFVYYISCGLTQYKA